MKFGLKILQYLSEKYFSLRASLRIALLSSLLVFFLGHLWSFYSHYHLWVPLPPTGPGAFRHFLQEEILILGSSAMVFLVGWFVATRETRELQRTKRRYEAIFEDSNILAALLEPDGTVRNVNEKAMSYTGKGKEEILGSSFPETPWWNHDETLQEDVQDWIDEAQSGQSVDFASKHLTPEGETRFIGGILRPVTNSHGTVVSLLATARDITEKKEKEHQLREAEKRFRQLAENIDAVFWIYDVENDESVYVSPRYEEIWERSRDSFEDNPRSYLEGVIEEDRERAREVVHTLPQGHHDVEYRINTPGGELKWIRDQGFPIEGREGEVKRIAGFAEDITEQKKREQQLEETSEHRLTLLREVHHRVKNNMQVVSSILGLEARQDSSKDLRETLKNCQNRIQSMAMVHRHLYEESTFSHRVNLGAYLEELSEKIFHSTLDRRNDLELRTSIPEQDLEVDLDTAIPLGLSVNELLTNALKHGFEQRKEGWVSLDFSRNSDGGIQLLISNNGAPLPDDFSPHEESGLGLQLVKNLVENQLHGTLDILSTENPTFSCQLPGDL